MRTWHITVAYNGGAYRGWQIQPDAVTVQGEIQKRLRHLFRYHELKLHGTSRTDAGVHALDQHATFRAPQPADMPPDRVHGLLNRWLPRDIRVQYVELAPEGFHARHNAQAKAYTYVLRPGDDCSPFELPYLWACPYELNTTVMKRTAAALVGTHDFTAFSASSGLDERDTGVRTLYALDVMRRGQYVFLSFIGNSFLYKMVRSLAGYFALRVGQCDTPPTEEVTAMLQDGTRPSWLQTAPPQGLFLARVFFQAGEWEHYGPLLPPFAWHMPANTTDDASRGTNAARRAANGA